MALEYSLDIETDLTVYQIENVILDKTDLTSEEDHIIGPGVYVRVNTESKIRKELIEEAFHFIPTIDIYMRLDKFENYHNGLDNVIKLTSALAKTIPNNMVLMFNAEYVYLLRKNGKVFLNAYDPKLWSSSMLRLLDLQFEFKNLGETYT